MGFSVNANEVADFGLYMGAEGSLSLPVIEKLAREEGLSADGFTGLLAPLGEICTGPAADAVGEAFDLMQKALCNLGDGLIATAEHYTLPQPTDEILAELDQRSTAADQTTAEQDVPEAQPDWQPGRLAGLGELAEETDADQPERAAPPPPRPRLSRRRPPDSDDEEFSERTWMR